MRSGERDRLGTAEGEGDVYLVAWWLLLVEEMRGNSLHRRQTCPPVSIVIRANELRRPRLMRRPRARPSCLASNFDSQTCSFHDSSSTLHIASCSTIACTDVKRVVIMPGYLSRIDTVDYASGRSYDGVLPAQVTTLQSYEKIFLHSLEAAAAPRQFHK